MQNKDLSGLMAQAGKHVSGAIQNAAHTTGVDFAYLLQQAKAESSFQSDAQASTSSASGLFQFIESTWMGMVEKHGEKYGLDKTASREDVLEKRNDPELAALMAAELAADNKAYLQKTGVNDIGSTELYFAHFLGARGASNFLNQRQDNPAQNAAESFPRAANANRNVFYDKDGGSKSLDEVYEFFDKKFQVSSQGKSEMVPRAESSASRPFSYLIGEDHPRYPRALMDDHSVRGFLEDDSFMFFAPKAQQGWASMWSDMLADQKRSANTHQLFMLMQSSLR